MGRRKVLALGATAGVGLLAAGVGGVEAGLLPGRARLHQVLGLTGPDGVVPTTPPGPARRGAFASGRMHGTRVRWVAHYPRDVHPTRTGLPVVLFLHGRHGDHRTAAHLGLDRFLGTRRFALVAVDGGPDGFWHRRRSGDAPGMLEHELLPRLERSGLRTDAIGLYGFSMGGYGALLFATRRPGRIRAVVAVAPSLWRSYEETQEGAFDDAADFERNDIFHERRHLDNVPLRIDCGNDDPFAPGVRAFAAGLPRAPEGGFQPGAHTDGYVRRLAPAHLDFLAKHLRA